MKLHNKDIPRKGNTKWTEDEEKILVNEVIRTPDNIHSAFERTAKILPARTVGSCSLKYYTNGFRDKYTDMLSVVSEKKISNNVKNKIRHKSSNEGLVIPITFDLAERVISQLSSMERARLISKYIT